MQHEEMQSGDQGKVGNRLQTRPANQEAKKETIILENNSRRSVLILNHIVNSDSTVNLY